VARAKEWWQGGCLNRACTDTRNNIFSNADGSPSSLFFGHIAGLQKYLPGAMSLFAPNVNSYRRISRYSSAPINVVVLVPGTKGAGAWARYGDRTHYVGTMNAGHESYGFPPTFRG
jgi:hypothetical protein